MFVLQRGRLALHYARDNEIRETLEFAVRSARGACETDDDLDASDDDCEKHDSVKTGEDATDYDLSSLPSSPVSSIPDAMDKDQSSEKMPGETFMNGLNKLAGRTQRMTLNEAQRAVDNFKHEEYDEEIDSNAFSDGIN